MKKTKKALASLAIAGMVLSMAPMSVFAADATATDRIFGADRIETAVKVAQAGWTTATTVIVAPAADANLVDALAAAPLAGQEKAPILLTDGAMLDAKTKQAIVDLKATKVYAVGALSAQVVTDLQGISGVTVEALKGADRIETATKIVAKLAAPAGSFVVGYNALADALSVASYAAANNYSILVANPDGSLPATEMPVGTKYVVGGPTLVADVAGATRLAGADRFETNQKVLSTLTYSYSKAYVANGEDAHLVDSLVASSLASQDKAVIVLGDTMSAKAAADVRAKLNGESQVVALGGTSVVPDSVKNSIAYVAPAELQVVSVSAVNAVTLEVKFNKAIDESTAEDTSNYEIYKTSDADVVLDVEEAELLKDDQTVLLHLDHSSALTDTDTKYTVRVLKTVLDTDGEELKSYTALINLSDMARPTVTSTDLVDNDTMEINFSEPVNGITDGDVTGSVVVIDEDEEEVAGLTMELNDDADELSIMGLSGLDSEETYTIRIYGDVVDFAANPISPNPYEKTFSVSEDEKAPKVSSITGVSKQAFKVVFTEPVDIDTITGSVDTVDFDSAEIEVVKDTNNKEFIVDLGDANRFTDLLKVTIDAGYEDVAGNAQSSSYSKYIRFTDAGPVLEATAASIKTIGGDKYAVLSFDKDIDEVTTSAAITATYVDEDGITNEDSITGFITSADEDALDDNQVAIPLTGLEAGSYKLTLPEGFANSYGAVSKKVDITFVVGEGTSDVEVDEDATLPVDADTVMNGDNNITGESTTKMFVVFTDEMGDSAKDAANYTVDGLKVFDKAEFWGNKMTVRLTFKTGSIKYTSNYELATANLKDADGNEVDDFDAKVRLAENVKPYITKAEVTALNTIELTFNEIIAGASVLDAADFDVYINGSEVDLADVDFAAQGKVVTLTLENDITDLDATIKVKTTADFSGKDLAGNTGTTNYERTAVWAD